MQNVKAVELVTKAVERMTEAEKGYLAGVIDGEGCIALYLANYGKSLAGRIVIVNTNAMLLQWLVQRLGGFVTWRKQAKPHHKPQFEWRLEYKPALALLRSLLPYLVLKKAQAELALYAWENRQEKRHRRSGLAPGVLEARQGFISQMHVLNQKGVEVA